MKSITADMPGVRYQFDSNNTMELSINNIPISLIQEHQRLAVSRETEYIPINKELIINAYKESIERLKKLPAVNRI